MRTLTMRTLTMPNLQIEMPDARGRTDGYIELVITDTIKEKGFEYMDITHNTRPTRYDFKYDKFLDLMIVSNIEVDLELEY